MGNSKEKIPLQRVDANRWRIPQHYNAAMHVPGMVYADDELIDRSPVPAFRKKLKLNLPKRGKAPFDDGELVKLWKALEADEDVFLYAAQFSAEAGNIAEAYSRSLSLNTQSPAMPASQLRSCTWEFQKYVPPAGFGVG